MKGQRVIWPERAMVDIETFELPNIKDDEVLIATECTLDQSWHGTRIFVITS